MANAIGKKIDSLAQNYQNQLRTEEGKTGRKMTKYDVAQYMVKNGILSKADFDNWLKTDEGKNELNLTKQQREKLKRGNVFGYANFGQESYLDSVSEFSLGNVLGFEKTSNGKIKSKPVVKKNFSVKKNIEMQKFKTHINSLPKTDEDYIQLMKDVKTLEENKKISEMTEFERKQYIMGKFLDAKNKNDRSAMFSALEEFYGYQCQVLDKKFGITDAKDFVKNTSGLNALVDYIDKAVDDNKSTLSGTEIGWEIIKGFGDALDGLIGTQGLTFAGALGGATKLASMSKTLGPVVGGAIQAYFGVEGTKLVAEGTADIVNAETKEEVREGGAKVGMGGIMVTGGVKSAKKGFETRANMEARKNFIENATDLELMDEYNARWNYGFTEHLSEYRNELVKRGYVEGQGGFAYSQLKVQGAPKNYRERLRTPDYSNVREKFPSDAFMTETKPGKATAYTTTGEPDGIVYRGSDGKLYVPNKWSPESPHEVKPGSVIMIYDEAGGDFAVGEPTVIAKTYRNPATNQIDPLYDVTPGRANAIEIQKDVVPSAFKIVPEGTIVKTKEAPNGVTVKEGQAVMYDIDGDPYVVDIQKTLLKRQVPVNYEAKAAFQALKEGKPLLTVEETKFLESLKENAKKGIEDPKELQTILTRLDANKHLVIDLSELKLPNGKARFTTDDIDVLMLNLKEATLNNPSQIFDAIEKADKYGYEPGAFGVWKCLYY